jgi:hypothetical protein
VHPAQITPWKHQLQQKVPQIFLARRAKREHDQEALQAPLYQQTHPERRVCPYWLRGVPITRNQVWSTDITDISGSMRGLSPGWR